MAYDRDRNGDILLELRDGVPFQAQLANTPVRSDHRLNTWAVFLQDQWRVRRFTLNAGLRLDGVEGNVPAQSSPAEHAGERSFEEISGAPDFPINVAPRVGVSYDLFGTGRTALKAYYGRFYNQFGSEIPESVNPNGLALIPVSWNDSTATCAPSPASWARSRASRAASSRASIRMRSGRTAKRSTPASSTRCCRISRCRSAIIAASIATASASSIPIVRRRRTRR